MWQRDGRLVGAAEMEAGEDARAEAQPADEAACCRMQRPAVLRAGQDAAGNRDHDHYDVQQRRGAECQSCEHAQHEGAPGGLPCLAGRAHRPHGDGVAWPAVG
jgi:hypothetical protein